MDVCNYVLKHSLTNKILRDSINSELIAEFQYLDKQIKNTPVTNDEIQALVKRVDIARQQGDIDKTNQLLVEASDLAKQEVERGTNGALESRDNWPA